jgi:hypothetical protein
MSAIRRAVAELLVLAITLIVFNVLLAQGQGIDHNFCAFTKGGNCSSDMACFQFQGGSGKVVGYAHPQCQTSVINNCCLYPARNGPAVCYIYYAYTSNDCSGTAQTYVGEIAACYGDTPGQPCQNPE